jgi:ribosomal protein S18 acetylase RimI-like enzyme
VDDTDVVVALWQACGLTRPWNNPHHDILRKLDVQSSLFVVGEQGSDIIASAMFGYDGHRGWVNYLAVLPSQHRRGYARQLMEYGERELLSRGCPKLNLQIRSDNLEAKSFYIALGYAEDEVVSFGKRLLKNKRV